MGWQEQDLNKTDQALKGPAIVHVYYAKPSWVKDGVVKGWKVIIEHNNQLQWVLCYHEKLTKLGMHPDVEFGRNSNYERTIKPWKRAS